MQQALDVLTGFNNYSIYFRLILAVVLGGCIGAERSRHGRPAGLRTYALVSVGACMSTLIGLYSVNILGLDADPLRLGAQVVSGIGFLGAGTIISDKHAHITGLTTAAGLWTAACIGLAVGLGFYSGAILAFILLFLVVAVLSKFEADKQVNDYISYYIEADSIDQLDTLYSELINIGDVQVIDTKSRIPGNMGLVISIDRDKNTNDMLERLKSMNNIVLVLPITI